MLDNWLRNEKVQFLMDSKKFQTFGRDCVVTFLAIMRQPVARLFTEGVLGSF